MKNYDLFNRIMNNFNKSNKGLESPFVQLFYELTPVLYSVTMVLSIFITKKDGILRHNKKVLTIKEMATLLGMEYDALRKHIPKLIEQKIIIKENVVFSDIGKSKTCFVANPYLYLFVDDICDKHLDLFIDSKWCEKYDIEIKRNSPKYRRFINDVLDRDNYTCQCCASNLNPEVHHILNYAKYKDLRTDITNGIVLCECCHSAMIKGSFHNTYGTRNNTKEQLQEYINNKRNELGLDPKTI